MPTKIVIALLVIAALLRVGFVVATPSYTPLHDDRDYDRLGCAIATGGSYPRLPTKRPTARSCEIPGQQSSKVPVTYRPPGFPYLLAGSYFVSRPFTNDRVTVARILLAFVGVLLVWLAGLVAAEVWGRRVGLIALGLAAVCPPLIIVGGSLLSEPMFASLALAAVLMMLKHRQTGKSVSWALVATSVFAGLAWLTRSNGMLLIAVLAIAAIGPSPRLRWRALAPALLVAAVSLLVIAPWTIRNAVVTGELIPVDSSSGPTLAGTYNATSLNDRVRPGAWRLINQVPELRKLSETYAGSDYQYDTHMRRSAIEYVIANPTAPFVVGFWGTRRLFFVGGGGPRWQAFSVGVASQSPRLGLLVAISVWIYALLAIVGAFTRRARRASLWFWAVPVMLFLSAALVNSELRFDLPFIPWLVMLGALAIGAATRRLDQGREELPHLQPDGPHQ